MKIDIQKFDKLMTKETSERDQLPPHTLDWYIYNNRVDLLTTVKTLCFENNSLQELTENN